MNLEIPGPLMVKAGTLLKEDNDAIVRLRKRTGYRKKPVHEYRSMRLNERVL